MATGYEDIDNFAKQQQANIEAQRELQNQATDLSTQKTIDELNYNRNKIDRETVKTTSGLYTDYQKEVNQYGVQADQQARKGLGNSGYAETARVNLYNTYQKNVSEAVNNANQLKADYDFQIAQAKQQGDITKAQNEFNLFQQQMELLAQEYEMRQNRKQFLYQQQRDKITDSQWQKNFDYQKSRDSIEDSQWQQSFDYQKSRDKVSDSQWQKQYELSKKASSRSSSSSRSTSSSKKSGNLVITDDDGNDKDKPRPTKEKILENIKVLQQPGNQGAVYDGISKKKFANLEALLNYYNYATAE